VVVLLALYLAGLVPVVQFTAAQEGYRDPYGSPCNPNALLALGCQPYVGRAHKRVGVYLVNLKWRLFDLDFATGTYYGFSPNSSPGDEQSLD
jgi:hypothetical protein